MAADPADRYRRLDPDAAGERIGELHQELLERLAPEDRSRVSELTELLATVHGAGLARVLDVAAAQPAGERVVEALLADPLVASLLLVHDLHPSPTILGTPRTTSAPVPVAPPTRRR